MPGTNYDRYGLTGNPFRDLSSENLDDIEIFHVQQELDRTLQTIKDEVFDKENKAMVALVGGHGAGKTHRLRLAASEGKQRGAYTVYFDIPEKTTAPVLGLATQMLASKTLGGFAKVFAPPPWYREVSKLVRAKPGSAELSSAGKAIARALNDNAPSLLLLNDLHNLTDPKAANAFALVLQELSDSLRPGVLVMFGCYPVYLASLTRSRPTFASRINRTLVIPTLTPEDAGLLLAKKLLAKRVVEDLDPTYPFDSDAIAALTSAAYGNPRRLLELADHALAYGAEHRTNRVDAAIVNLASVAPPPPTVDPPAPTPPLVRPPTPTPGRAPERS